MASAAGLRSRSPALAELGPELAWECPAAAWGHSHCHRGSESLSVGVPWSELMQMCLSASFQPKVSGVLKGSVLPVPQWWPSSTPVSTPARLCPLRILAGHSLRGDTHRHCPSVLPLYLRCTVLTPSAVD